MFYIQSPQKKEFFVELLDGNTFEEVTFKFIKIEGMKIFFEFEGDVDVAQAIAVAKAAIRKEPLGGVLYYMLQAV